MILLCCLIFTSCKTTAPIVPLVLKDSVSITYKQGKEQPTPTGVIGAAIESRKNSGVPADGTVGLGATQGASVFEGLLSQRTNKKAVPPTTTIRVDTVFVERWHTQILQPEGRSYSESGPSGEAGLSAKRSQFYKRCTWGFFLLILLFFGRLAFRIIKAIYFKR